eukprot:scaffold649_cov347-Pavlova_lutheri.AAC.58
MDVMVPKNTSPTTLACFPSESIVPSTNRRSRAFRPGELHVLRKGRLHPRFLPPSQVHFVADAPSARPTARVGLSPRRQRKGTVENDSMHRLGERGDRVDGTNIGGRKGGFEVDRPWRLAMNLGCCARLCGGGT